MIDEVVKCFLGVINTSAMEDVKSEWKGTLTIAPVVNLCRCGRDMKRRQLNLVTVTAVPFVNCGVCGGTLTRDYWDCTKCTQLFSSVVKCSVCAPKSKETPITMSFVQNGASVKGTMQLHSSKKKVFPYEVGGTVEGNMVTFSPTSATLGKGQPEYFVRLPVLCCYFDDDGLMFASLRST